MYLQVKLDKYNVLTVICVISYFVIFMNEILYLPSSPGSDVTLNINLSKTKLSLLVCYV